MKWLELTEKFTFYTFRNWDDYREGCIEVPDDMPSPPLDWVWDGTQFNAPVVPPTPPYVPTSISMRQCRLELLAQGYYDAVNSAVSTMPQSAQIEWEYATEVQRSNPLVPQMQQLLGLTDAEMDNLYIEAFKR